MATPIPVATFGKDPNKGKEIREKLLPEIVVVHVCLDDVDTAVAELPAVCAGDLSNPPASGFGTNAEVATEERQAPTAVFFGNGVSDEEMEKISVAVLARNPNIKLIKVGKLDVLARGSLIPKPSAIAKAFKDKLQEAMGA